MKVVGVRRGGMGKLQSHVQLVKCGQQYVESPVFKRRVNVGSIARKFRRAGRLAKLPSEKWNVRKSSLYPPRQVVEERFLDINSLEQRTSKLFSKHTSTVLRIQQNAQQCSKRVEEFESPLRTPYLTNSTFHFSKVFQRRGVGAERPVVIHHSRNSSQKIEQLTDSPSATKSRLYFKMMLKVLSSNHSQRETLVIRNSRGPAVQSESNQPTHKHSKSNERLVSHHSDKKYPKIPTCTEHSAHNGSIKEQAELQPKYALPCKLRNLNAARTEAKIGERRSVAGLELLLAPTKCNGESRAENCERTEDSMICDPEAIRSLADSLPQVEECEALKEVQAGKHALLTPTNLEEQQQAFMAQDGRMNPQFTYESSKLAARYLKLFTKPSGHILDLAIKIIEAFLRDYGSESQFLEDYGGDILSIEETKEIFSSYVNELGLRDRIVLQFSSSTVAPTTITHDPKYSTITIGLPIEYRRSRVLGVLDHEIGTHFLRKLNDSVQPWHSARRRFLLRNFIATEEGLASLNQLYDQAKNRRSRPYLFKAALYYYACCRAVNMSFVELYEDLGKFIDDPQRRFKICVRAKRGLQDTGAKGGLYKDKVYFEGAIKVLQRRRQVNLKLLFSGKISVDDLQRPEIVAKINEHSLVLPYFAKDVEEYSRVLDAIAHANFVTDP